MRSKMMILAREDAAFKKMFLSGARTRGFIEQLIPLAVSVFGGKKKSSGGQQVQPQRTDDRSPERSALDAFLADFVMKNGSNYEPMKQFGGKFTAPMGGLEKSGIETFLPQFLNQPDVSSNTQDARDLLNRTVKGGFNPGSDPYYQALRTEAHYNRKRAVDQSRANMGARGRFFSSEAMREEGDINAQTSNHLQTILAELGDKERTRSMQAVAPSLALEESIGQVPLRKAEAATSIGSLPRILEQADLEAVYQDFLRRQDEGAGVINAGSRVGGYSVNPREEYAAPALQAPRSNATSDFLQKLVSSAMPHLMDAFRR